MVSNYIQHYLDQELDLQLPNELEKWILDEFPIKEIVYRGKTFTFLSDIPIDCMEEVADSKGDKVNQIKVMMKVLSIEPKITDEHLKIMPSSMLMGLYDLIFPKNEPTSSPSENIKDTSSVQS